MPSNFVWYELMTTDLDAAEAFYKTVVGWNSEPFDSPQMRYSIMKAGDTAVAGLMTIPEEAARMGARPAWTGYIYAENVDAATESLRKAGGSVYREPADIPEVGRFSVVADPQGAMFTLFTPKGEGQPPAPPMTPGHVGWHELYAAEWKSAFDFYSGQFGWTKTDAMDMGEMGTYQLFAAAGSGDAIGGMFTKPADVPHPFWLYYFNVGDIDDAMQRVTGNGGKVLMGPMEVPGGSWVLQATDPQGGAMFALVGRKG
jgi:predicted enzyme related to lactoylglutathione lyase